MVPPLHFPPGCFDGAALPRPCLLFCVPCQIKHLTASTSTKTGYSGGSYGGKAARDGVLCGGHRRAGRKGVAKAVWSALGPVGGKGRKDGRRSLGGNLLGSGAAQHGHSANSGVKRVGPSFGGAHQGAATFAQGSCYLPRVLLPKARPNESQGGGKGARIGGDCGRRTAWPAGHGVKGREVGRCDRSSESNARSWRVRSEWGCGKKVRRKGGVRWARCALGADFGWGLRLLPSAE